VLRQAGPAPRYPASYPPFPTGAVSERPHETPHTHRHPPHSPCAPPFLCTPHRAFLPFRGLCLSVVQLQPMSTVSKTSQPHTALNHSTRRAFCTSLCYSQPQSQPLQRQSRSLPARLAGSKQAKRPPPPKAGRAPLKRFPGGSVSFSVLSLCFVRLPVAGCDSIDVEHYFCGVAWNTFVESPRSQRPGTAFAWLLLCVALST